MNDKQIKEDILRELEQDPDIDSSKISIVVEDGIVTLRGEVDSYRKKLSIEKAVKKVRGIKGIAQNITTKYLSTECSDADIADASVNAIKLNTTVPNEYLSVKVENGWVTLEGDVEWEYQKRIAERIVKKIAGVKGVSNLVSIRRRIHSTVIKKDIKNKMYGRKITDKKRLLREQDHLTRPPRLENSVQKKMMRSTKKSNLN